MQLTRQGEYAIRIILDLARRQGEIVPRRDIAHRQDVPEAFLAKTVQLLVKSGLVYTARGVGGGVSLARPPEEITLRQVVEAVEGPLALNICLLGQGACQYQEGCPVHPVWRRVQEAMAGEMDSVTFAQLAGG